MCTVRFCCVEVEVFGVFLVSWCGQEFGDNIAWVCCCFYSPDVYFAFQVVLANFMVPDVDGPTMFVQVGLSRQMFGCLIIREKVIQVFFVTINLKYCGNESTCCVSSGQCYVFSCTGR